MLSKIIFSQYDKNNLLKAIIIISKYYIPYVYIMYRNAGNQCNQGNKGNQCNQANKGNQANTGNTGKSCYTTDPCYTDNIRAIIRKKKLIREADALKKELIDLQLLNDSSLFTVCGSGNWDITPGNATNPGTMKQYMNNISNGVNYYNNLLCSLNHVIELITELKEVFDSWNNPINAIQTERKTELKIQFALIRANLYLVQNDAKYNDEPLYDTRPDPSIGNPDVYRVIYGIAYDAKIDLVKIRATQSINIDADVSDPGIDEILITSLNVMNIALATTTINRDKLVFYKLSINNQHEYTMTSINEYKESRENELISQIEIISRAVELIDAVYRLKFY